MPSILTQREFIARFHVEFGRSISPANIHKLMASGMPTVNVGGKKPRFHWDTCRNWILSNPNTNSFETQITDKIFRRSLQAAN